MLLNVVVVVIVVGNIYSFEYTNPEQGTQSEFISYTTTDAAAALLFVSTSSFFFATSYYSEAFHSSSNRSKIHLEICSPTTAATSPSTTVRHFIIANLGMPFQLLLYLKAKTFFSSPNCCICRTFHVVH